MKCLTILSKEEDLTLNIVTEPIPAIFDQALVLMLLEVCSQAVL